jgi:hypothetical protein
MREAPHERIARMVNRVWSNKGELPQALNFRHVAYGVYCSQAYGEGREVS